MTLFTAQEKRSLVGPLRLMFSHRFFAFGTVRGGRWSSPREPSDGGHMFRSGENTKKKVVLFSTFAARHKIFAAINSKRNVLLFWSIYGCTLREPRVRRENLLCLQKSCASIGRKAIFSSIRPQNCAAELSLRFHHPRTSHRRNPSQCVIFMTNDGKCGNHKKDTETPNK